MAPPDSVNVNDSFEDDLHQFRNIVCGCCGFSIPTPVSCGNRFCPLCSAPRNRKIRAKLDSIISSLVAQEGFSVKFLTLTIPNGSDVKKLAAQLTSSFRRLRQTKFWKAKVHGGAFVLEITGSPGNWNVHLHAIIESMYLNQGTLVQLWKKCSPGLVVDIRRLDSKSIIFYVTKYMTKSNLKTDMQVSVSKELKHIRLFQPFGTWHKVAIKVKKLLYDCPKCGHCAWFPADLPDRWNPYKGESSSSSIALDDVDKANIRKLSPANPSPLT